MHGQAARARRDRRRPVQHLPDDARPGRHAEGVRRRDHPGLQRGDCVKLPRDPDDPLDVEGLEGDEARLDGIAVRDAVVQGGSLANVRALRSEWRRVRFENVRATGLQFAEATLADVTFEGARLDFASFRLARLERVVFRGCRLEETDFAGAKLESVLFEQSPLTGATLSFAGLEDVELRGCDLDGVSGAETLRGAQMSLQDVLASATTLAGALGIQIAPD